MKSIALKYGSISGVILGVLFMSTFFLLEGEEPRYELGEAVGYITMVLSLLVVYFGVKSYRDVDLGGSISFGKALATGLLISAVAAFIFALFDTVYITVINPEFYKEYMDWKIDTMRSDGESEANIATVVKQFEMFTGPVGALLNGIVMFFTVFLIGLVISLISSGILKKDADQASTSV